MFGPSQGRKSRQETVRARCSRTGPQFADLELRPVPRRSLVRRPGASPFAVTITVHLPDELAVTLAAAACASGQHEPLDIRQVRRDLAARTLANDI